MAGPLTRQAQNEAVVRFGPQRFALRELLAQAIMTRDTALRAAAGAERGIQAALQAARKETVSNYGAAQATTAGTREGVDAALQGLGSAGSPFAAAIARERGGAQDRLTEGEANTLQDLTRQRVAAASGRAFATSKALGDYGTDVGKIQRSYQELASEQGAFTQGRVGELKKEQADRQFQRDLAEMRDATSRRGQDITSQGQKLSHQDRVAAERETARHNKAAEQKKTTANRPRHGVGSLTQGEENKIKDTVNSVLSIITNPPAFEDPPKGSPPGTKGPKLTHQRMLQHLRNGSNPLGKPIPQDIIEVAYNLRDNGGVLSQPAIDRLHARGMHIPPEWLPKKPRNGGGYAGLNTPAPSR